MCTLTNVFTLLVTLRPRLVTWGRCHGNQERVAKVRASGEEKRCVDMPLQSCALAVHSIPTTASTNVESVVNGYVQFIAARCAWRRSLVSESLVLQEAIGLGATQTHPKAHRDAHDLEEEGENVVVCLSSLKVSPRFGLVSPAEFRWTHNIVQRLFRLEDVRRMSLPGSVRVLYNHRNCT